MKDLLDVLQFLQEKWEKRSTATIITIIIFIFFALHLDQYINFSGETFNQIVPNWIPIRNTSIFYLSIETIYLIVWNVSRRVPKINKNSFGLVIAIKTDNLKNKTKLKFEFIEQIKLQLEGQGSIKVIALTEYHTEKIIKNRTITTKYHKKTNCNLIVFGTMEIVTHCGEEHYDLRLDASLRHSPIPIMESRFLSAEMRNALPQDQLIPLQNEFIGFRFSSNLFSVMARYLLGISAYYSSKLEDAYKMHSSIYSETIELAKETNDFPIYLKIRDTVKRFLFNEAFILSQIAYHIDKDYRAMDIFINIMQEIDPNNYSAHLQRAIYLFRACRNIEGSKSEIALAAQLHTGDYTWAYSRAFLFAYEGDLENAYKLYEIAFYHMTDKTAYLQTEIFINEILEEEPEKYQLYYALGLIYFKKMEDRVLAKESFETFITKDSNNNKYTEHTKWAKKYLERC
jgi:tetratricopeptide (TPR) repeat protein